MLESKRFPDVSDKAMEAELYAAGGGVNKQLRKAITGPLIAAAARIEEVILDPDALHARARFHPVMELPYTGLPPDWPGDESGPQLPTSIDEASRAIAVYWPGHLRHNAGTPGLRDNDSVDPTKMLVHLGREVLAQTQGRGRLTPPEWELYQKAHTEQHRRDYCDLGSLAADTSQIRHRQDPFADVGRAVIAGALPYRYPTLYYMGTSAEKPTGAQIRYPFDQEADPELAERIIRATGLVIDCLESDKLLRQDMAAVVAQDPDLIRHHTLRASDRPFDPAGSLVHGAQESVGRAILPMFAELTRGGQAMLPDVIAGDWVRKITRQLPVDYAGPAAGMGIGVEGPALIRNEDGLVQQNTKTRDTFEAMRNYWDREYHYPRLVERREAEEGSGSAPKELLVARLGLPCPVASADYQPGRTMLPTSAITALSEVIFLAASQLEDHTQGTHFDNLHPYRPSDVPGFGEPLPPACEGYRHLGRNEAIRQVKLRQG